MTSSGDVSNSVSARGRRVLSPPTREGDAGNPGGAWGRVPRRMTTRFSGHVDRWTIRPSWWHVWLRSSLGVENLRRRVCEFQEPLSAHGGACGCSWRSSFWVSFVRGRVARLWCWFHQAKQGFAQIWRIKSRLCLSLLDFDTTQSHGGCKMPWSQDPAEKHVWFLMMVCTWYSSLLARDICLIPRTKFGSDTMLNISNAMWYTMLCMLEWMQKEKHRIGTLWTRG